MSRILQHLALTVNLPDNYADWDQAEISLAEHHRRKYSVILETCVLISFHAISNLLMLIPIWVTGGMLKKNYI